MRAARASWWQAIACSSSARTPSSSFADRSSIEPQAEVDVAEQAALLGDLEPRPGLQLARSADVVEQRRAEQEVGAQPRMKLHELPADRRDADHVLEQPAGVDVMRLR